MPVDTAYSMLSAERLRRVFCCCVTSQPLDQQIGDSGWTTSLPDDDDVEPVWSTASVTHRYVAAGCRHCAYFAVDVHDDPSAPVPVCCCERCDGGWFPPEVSALHLRSCLLACDAHHVTTGKTLSDSGQRRCAWTGDAIYLDDVEKSEMSLMSRDLKGVDLLVCAPSCRLCKFYVTLPV